MKNNLLFCVLLFLACTLSMHLNAQIEVLTSGNVTVTKRIAVNGVTPSDNIGVFVKAPAPSTGTTKYGVYSYMRVINPQSSPTGCNISLLGRVAPLSTPPLTSSDGQLRLSYPFYAGVAGVASTGIGIYGSNTTTFPSTWTEGSWAGYFSGNVKVTGTLTYGQLNSRLGDSRFMDNVTPLGSRDTADMFSLLNPVSFTVSQDSTDMVSKDANTTHYGFVAQELQEIAPELVREDADGVLSINYLELIPILIKKVQELSAEVEELKNTSK